MKIIKELAEITNETDISSSSSDEDEEETKTEPEHKEEAQHKEEVQQVPDTPQESQDGVPPPLPPLPPPGGKPKEPLPQESRPTPSNVSSKPNPKPDPSIKLKAFSLDTIDYHKCMNCIWKQIDDKDVNINRKLIINRFKALSTASKKVD